MVHVLKRSQSLPSLWKMANGDGIHSEKCQPEKVGDMIVCKLMGISLSLYTPAMIVQQAYCFQRMLGTFYQQVLMILSNNL